MKSGHCLFPRRGITLSSHGCNPWYAAQIIRFFLALKGLPLQGQKVGGGVSPWVSPRATHRIPLRGISEGGENLVKSDAPLTDKTTADSSGRCDPIPTELARMGINDMIRYGGGVCPRSPKTKDRRKTALLCLGAKVSRTGILPVSEENESPAGCRSCFRLGARY
jgi:hypothetical protein